MLTSLQNPLALLGRLLIALMFIAAGWSKISGFDGTVGYIASKGLPLATLGAVLAIVVELGAGLALALGWRTQWAAVVLAGFTAVASVIFHNFWGAPAEQAMTQQLMFFKNVAIIGGLLGLAAWGAGALSLDGRRK